VSEHNYDGVGAPFTGESGGCIARPVW